MARMLTLLSFLLFFFVPLACPEPTGFRLALTHIDSKSNLTWSERVQRAAERSRTRRELLAGDLETTIVKSASGFEYLVEFEIGTPAVPVLAIADTGSDLIWTQCQPCNQCYPQPTPIFDPSKSSTYALLPCTSPLCPAQANATCTECTYSYSYLDNSSTVGLLSTETFTFADGSQEVGLTFGCGELNNLTFGNASGIVGLGPGPLSLVSQLASGKFSYCLTTYENLTPSPLMFGSLAILNGTENATIQSTPLNSSSHYFINLVGISVGVNLLSIPNNTFDAGTVIDSGSSLTSLALPAYQLLREEIISLVNLPLISIVNFNLCFNLSSGSLPEMPTVTLHFDGGDMALPPENYMIVDTADSWACLTINPASGFSIIGNFQQQNLNVLYDLDGAMLSFVPAQCDQL